MAKFKHLARARKILLPLVFLAVGIGGFAWFNVRTPPPVTAAVEQKVWAVTVEEVALVTARPALRLVGVVESPRRTDLRAAVDAEVTAVHVLAGETVQAGQALVQLDDADLQLQLRQREADVAEAEASLARERIQFEADRKSLARESVLFELAQKDTERLRRVVKSQSEAEVQLDRSRSALQRAGLQLVARQLAVDGHPARMAMLQAQIARAEALRDQALLDLRRATVTAGADGKVTAVHVAAAGRVAAGAALVTMFDHSLVEVRAQIPDRDLPRVRRALAGGGSVAGETVVDGARLALTLDRLAAAVAPGQGGVDAMFRLADSAAAPELGRVVELFARLAPEPAVVTAPRQALYGSNKMFKVVDGKLAAVTVQLAGRTFTNGDGGGDDRLLVRSAQLADGDLLVVSALPNAVHGLPVRIAR